MLLYSLPQPRASVRRTSRLTNFKTRSRGSVVQSCNAVTISILKFQAIENNARAEARQTAVRRDHARFMRLKASLGRFVWLQFPIVPLASLGLAFVAAGGCTFWPTASVRWAAVRQPVLIGIAVMEHKGAPH
jgi:hypothetical protein